MRTLQEKQKGNIWIRVLFIWILTALLFAFYIGVYRGVNEPKPRHTQTNIEPAVHTLEEIRGILSGYPEFFTEQVLENMEKEKNFGTYVIPGLKATKTVRYETKQMEICTSMTPQGMDITDKYIFVSAYCHTKKHNSVLYMIDKEKRTFIKEIILPNRTHAGGLAYDGIRKVLWITNQKAGKAAVSLYTLKALENYEYDKTKKPLPFLDTHVLDGLTRNSFMAFRGGSLYAGYFSLTGDSVINKYSVDFERNEEKKEAYEDLEEEREFLSQVAIEQEWAEILPQIQGLEVFGNYLFLSQSYGYADSRLRIYEREALEEETYSLKKKEERKSYALPNRLEQICVQGGRLYLLFESGAYAYRGIPVNCVDRIISVSLNDILEDIKRKEDGGNAFG